MDISYYILIGFVAIVSIVGFWIWTLLIKHFAKHHNAKHITDEKLIVLGIVLSFLVSTALVGIVEIGKNSRSKDKCPEYERIDAYILKTDQHE